MKTAIRLYMSSPEGEILYSIKIQKCMLYVHLVQIIIMPSAAQSAVQSGKNTFKALCRQQHHFTREAQCLNKTIAIVHLPSPQNPGAPASPVTTTVNQYLNTYVVTLGDANQYCGSATNSSLIAFTVASCPAGMTRFAENCFWVNNYAMGPQGNADVCSTKVRPDANGMLNCNQSFSSYCVVQSIECVD